MILAQKLAERKCLKQGSLGRIMRPTFMGWMCYPYMTLKLHREIADLKMSWINWK
jgi:hypothetical protein